MPGDRENVDSNRRGILKMGACAGLTVALGSAGLSCCPSCSKKSETAAKTRADDLPTDWSTVAYCCLECDKCDVYVATQTNDDALRAKVAKEWKTDAEKLYCDGCKSDRALFNCEAKQCAVAKGLPTCAHCDDFPTCDKEIWTKWPILKQKTETMEPGCDCPHSSRILR
jgi:hypothetical protein